MRRWTDSGLWRSPYRWGGAAGVVEWPMFLPGLVLVLLGAAVLIEPRILIGLVAMAMIGLGAAMLVNGWRARRAWRCFDATFWRGFTRYP